VSTAGVGFNVAHAAAVGAYSGYQPGGNPAARTGATSPKEEAVPYVVVRDHIRIGEPMLPGDMWRSNLETGYQVGIESSLAHAREHFAALKRVAPSKLGADGHPLGEIDAYRIDKVVYDRYTIVHYKTGDWMDSPVDPHHPIAPSEGGRVVEVVWVEIPDA